jgi:hypothetical protein
MRLLEHDLETYVSTKWFEITYCSELLLVCYYACPVIGADDNFWRRSNKQETCIVPPWACGPSSNRVFFSTTVHYNKGLFFRN